MNPTSPPSQAGPTATDPQATIQTLNTIIKALVARYGEPWPAETPQIIATLTQTELLRSSHARLTIHPDKNDINPEPFLLITVEGL